MSAKGIAFAIDYDLRPATLRVLLIIMGNCANPETALCWPSLGYLVKKTGMNRKTLPDALDKLCELGLLEELPERAGKTLQIKIYRFTFGVKDQTGPISDTLETSPILPESSPESEAKGARNRGTEPSSRNLKEEETPPLPSEEHPHEEGDLFGGLPESIPIPLEDYVLEGWAKLREEYPRVQDVRVLNDSRRKKIRARAAEFVRGSKGAVTEYQVWDQIFDAIRNSVWLRGDAPPSQRYPTPFSLGIDYILRPTVFLQTLERAVNDEHDNLRTSDPRTGRRFGPAEQALRDAIASGLPSRKRRRGR
jgi:hypothetical protein